MPRPCSICQHPRREGIDKGLVAGGSYRSIAQRFGASPDAVMRHKRDHLPLVLAAAAVPQHPDPGGAKRGAVPQQHAEALVAQQATQEARRQAHAVDVMAEIGRLFHRMNKLFDACDRWLTDPDDPDRYDIGPRADEVTVVYLDGDTTRKARLSTLLRELHGATGMVYGGGDWKHADPRKLVLETAAQLRGQLELVVDLMERAHNAERMERLTEAILAALKGKAPDVAEAVLAALQPDQLPGWAARQD